MPQKPKPPEQVKDAAENERRAAVHAAALKDWAEHAERMAARKKAQKDASRPADDSERRVKQRRESRAQAETDAAGADERRMTKRLEAPFARVRQLEEVELVDALRDCVAHFSNDTKYTEARRALARAVYQMDFFLNDEYGEPHGDHVWDLAFDDAADVAPILPRNAPLRQRPALEPWQVEWLLSYEGCGMGWAEALAAHASPPGTPAAAVTGREVIDFLQRERRKGLAEAAFEAHLQRMFDGQRRSRYGESLRDADSVWWREALGEQHKRRAAAAAVGLCCCGWRVCRCPIGCVLDADCEPIEPRRFAMSGEC